MGAGFLDICFWAFLNGGLGFRVKGMVHVSQIFFKKDHGPWKAGISRNIQSLSSTSPICETPAILEKLRVGVVGLRV